MAEIWGSETDFENACDKLKSKLDDLVTAMASGYDPALNYSYDKHRVALLQLNAVSFEIVDTLTEYVGGGAPAGVTFYHTIFFEIRIHTGYAGASQIDTIKNRRLLNSISNYLNVYRNLADGYRIGLIYNANPDESFEDSQTIGGSMRCEIKYVIKHTQA